MVDLNEEWLSDKPTWLAQALAIIQDCYCLLAVGPLHLQIKGLLNWSCYTPYMTWMQNMSGWGEGHREMQFVHRLQIDGCIDVTTLSLIIDTSIGWTQTWHNHGLIWATGVEKRHFHTNSPAKMLWFSNSASSETISCSDEQKMAKRAPARLKLRLLTVKEHLIGQILSKAQNI